MPKSFALFVLLLAATTVFGEGTRTWQQSSFDEFEKGTTTGVAITSDGSLELAPSFRVLYLTPSTYTWAMDTDSDGNVYVAAGSPARVYRVTPEGKATVIFAPQELQVQTVIVGPNNDVYAGTSPDGKVYKIERNKGASARQEQSAPQSKTNVLVDSNYSSSVLFNPGTKYIWALALDKQGNLYVATGDRGEIFKVAKNGEHSLFFKSDEAHIRVLAVDGKGNLIAGSDGSGLIYRISPDGQAFVLYSAPKKEITALAIDANGNIYAGAVGEKRIQAGGPVPLQLPPASVAAGPQTMGLSISPIAPSPAPVVSVTSFPTAGGSEVYRIAPDGSPTTLWSSRDDLVYALAFDKQGRLLAGTGNKGHVYALTGLDEFTDLLKAPANQVTGFAKAPHGGLYACSSNFGKVLLLGPQAQPEGTYESDVFDAHIFSRWGRAEVRSSGSVDFYARSGNVDNPDRNWSAWQKVDLLNQGAVAIPSARFVQWKAVLHDGSTPAQVESVLLNYLPKNVAPEVDDVTVQVGFRYQALPKPPADAGGGGGSQSNAPLPPAIHDRDSIAVHWSAQDDNDDQLVYSLYYRGDGDTRWLLLKQDLDDRFYSFDSSLLPDGGYAIKVIASDAPSHSPREALTSSQESPRFEVDTTPPAIQNLRGALAGDQLRVSFRAVDTFSPIKRAEYSIDAKDWQYVDPVGQISDSKTEAYDFSVPVPAGDTQEHIVVVRAYDRFDNMGAAKFVLRPPAGKSKAGK